ncbi:hypothetical protein CsatB_003215 [Cannabis sativa]
MWTIGALSGQNALAMMILGVMEIGLVLSVETLTLDLERFATVQNVLLLGLKFCLLPGEKIQKKLKYVILVAWKLYLPVGNSANNNIDMPSHSPMTSHYNNPPPFYYGGFGLPPMPYGVSTRYGSPIPHTGVHYNYAAPSVAHGAYGPPAPTFPPGSFGGMGYASPSTVNGYGFGFPGSPWSGGMGIITENPASRKRRGGPDGSYDGDWICPKCENVNFAFRTVCNIKKCGAARPLGPTNQSNAGAPEGSWTCGKCGNVNYPFRTVCNRKECGTEKPSS